MKVYEKLAADYIEACKELEAAQQRVNLIKVVMKEQLHVASTATEGVLTHREAQVLKFLSELKTNKEIAIELGITERTVKFHVSNLLSKHNVKTRTQLIVILTLAAQQVSQRSEAVHMSDPSQPSPHTSCRRWPRPRF